MAIILGIDPGSNICGFAVVELNASTSHCKIIQYGSIQAEKKESYPVRMGKIGMAIEKLILDYKPQVLAIEEVFFAKNVKAALHLGQIRGVVLFLAQKYSLEVNEYAAKKVKKAITGSGAASKEQVAYLLQTLLQTNLYSENFDATDALALAYYQAQNELQIKVLSQLDV